MESTLALVELAVILLHLPLEYKQVLLKVVYSGQK